MMEVDGESDKICKRSLIVNDHQWEYELVIGVKVLTITMWSERLSRRITCTNLI